LRKAERRKSARRPTTHPVSDPEFPAPQQRSSPRPPARPLAARAKLLATRDLLLQHARHGARTARRTLLTSTGACRLKELLRKKLIERGWRDELKDYCKEVIKSKGLEQISVEDLVRPPAPPRSPPLGRKCTPAAAQRRTSRAWRAAAAQRAVLPRGLRRTGSTAAGCRDHASRTSNHSRRHQGAGPCALDQYALFDRRAGQTTMRLRCAAPAPSARTHLCARRHGHRTRGLTPRARECRPSCWSGSASSSRRRSALSCGFGLVIR